jgi:excinuclease ABC subunit C
VFDNSHLQGTNQLGGMIVAGPDGFMKNQYRKFNIKDETTQPGDDYAMMRAWRAKKIAAARLGLIWYWSMAGVGN